MGDWWVKNLLRHTSDISEDASVTISVDCQSGYTWQGELWDLRDALQKAVELAELKKTLTAQVPLIPTIPSETLSFEPPMWEYKMIKASNVGIDMLDTLGSEGWEIISLNIEDNVILFKRPKNE